MQGLNQHRGAQHDPPWTDADRLREMVLERQMSVDDIGDELGCSGDLISKHLDRHNIPSISDLHVGVRTLPQGYEQIHHYYEGDHWTLKLHRLIAVAEYGTDAVKDSYIHHENEIPWDNRPSNLTPMDPEDHGRKHMYEYYESAPWRDPEKLKAALSGGSITAAAEELGCRRKTVYRWMDNHDISV
jgi:hypothetical protein